MKKLSYALLALVTVAAIAPAAYAGPVNPLITGGVTVTGNGATWDASTISFDSSTPTSNFVSASTGNLAVAQFSSATMLSTFTFVPPVSNTSVQLFALANGETFVVEGSDVTLDNGTYLDISGWGYLEETGYSNTGATFTLAATANGSNSYTLDVTVTPEPSSLLFLGTGLLGLGLLVRTRLTH